MSLSQLGTARLLVELERQLLGSTPAKHVTALWSLTEREKARGQLRSHRPRQQMSEAPSLGSAEKLMEAKQLAGEIPRSVNAQDTEQVEDHRLMADLEARVRQRQQDDQRASELREAESLELLGTRLVESMWPDALEGALSYFERARALYRQIPNPAANARVAQKQEQARQMRRLLSESAGNAQVLESLTIRLDGESGPTALPSPFDRPLDMLRTTCEELLAAKQRHNYLEALLLVPVLVGWYRLARRMGGEWAARQSSQGEPQTVDGLMGWLGSVQSPHHAIAQLTAWILTSAERRAQQSDRTENLVAGQRQLEGSIKALGEKISSLESAIGLLQIPADRESSLSREPAEVRERQGPPTEPGPETTERVSPAAMAAGMGTQASRAKHGDSWLGHHKLTLALASILALVWIAVLASGDRTLGLIGLGRSDPFGVQPIASSDVPPPLSQDPLGSLTPTLTRELGVPSLTPATTVLATEAQVASDQLSGSIASPSPNATVLPAATAKAPATATSEPAETPTVAPAQLPMLTATSSSSTAGTATAAAKTKTPLPTQTYIQTPTPAGTQTRSTITPTALSLTAVREGRLFAIAGTNGSALNLRQAPTTTSDVVRSWREGTTLVALGPTAQAEGWTWYNVRDPLGNVGWVPAQFLAPSNGQ